MPTRRIVVAALLPCCLVPSSRAAPAAETARETKPVAGGRAAVFEVRLPTVTLGYPGAEYWGEIEGPGGARLRAFARYEGKEAWTIPFAAETEGSYRLVRIVKRQGGTEETVAAALPIEIRVTVPSAAAASKVETLVDAGAFTPFFAAQEPWCVNDHTLVQGPDGAWHLFGITHPKPLDFFKDPGRSLAHATAKSLLHKPWEARPPAVRADWDRYREYLLWAPHVVRHGGTYYMFVCAGDKDTHRYRLHLLTSPDLETWTRHADNPLCIDGFDARDPMVMPLGEKWVMYYTATSDPEGGNHIVACLTSADLVHWSDRRVAFVHPRAGTFGGPTESPFVVRRGERFYLFACDNDWTDVYVSNDPFHWDYERTAGRIKAHAAEVVRDADGAWYVTHAGWMQGPVCLAPLSWRDGLDAAATSVPRGSSAGGNPVR